MSGAADGHVVRRRLEEFMREQLSSMVGKEAGVAGSPLLVLREPVIFPYCLTPVLIDGELNGGALKLAMSRDRMMALFFEAPGEAETANRDYPCGFETVECGGRALCTVGVLVRTVKVLNFPDGTTRALLRGVKRVRLVSFSSLSDVICVAVEPLPDIPKGQLELEGAMKAVARMFQEYAGMQPNLADELKIAVVNTVVPARLVDLLADNLNFDYVEKLLLLTLPLVTMRFHLLITLLNREIEVTKIGLKIQNDVHQAMSQSQREFFLREQLRTIQHELGEEFRNPDIVEIRKRLDGRKLPEQVANAVNKELSRLEIIPQAAPEYHIAYTYICWLLDLPWLECGDDRLDVKQAAEVLDDDHYGLEDVKKRILEFLAVLQLKPDRKAPIICLVGPPGVGKTSLGQSIARALNRKFVRVALGGVRDEAEIRGHRRTYVGALPGRIIQGMKRAGVANPVFMLDEIDKLGNDVHGDPASALLEVLDPEQNVAFNDHYLELDYDLSRVFFLTTANLLDTIPPPLRDRMEIIRLPGYTSFEKREIARRYLVPRQIRENGLKVRQIRFNMSGIDEIIDHYTREAGVRELERSVAQVCRRLARRIIEGEIDKKAVISVNADLVRELLGARIYLMDEAEPNPDVGVVTGMAWTSSGGTILSVEALSAPGKGDLKLTGSLGKVMQESAEAAFSFVQSHAKRWEIEPEVFNKCNFHIHVPDGATPKDGPSAGITLGVALVSLLTGRAVRPYLAMTGEITLRGKITAVGGIREKVIAAMRSGIRQVILPEENRKDTEELPEEVRRRMKFIFVGRFEDAVDFALLPAEKDNVEQL